MYTAGIQFVISEVRGTRGHTRWLEGSHSSYASAHQAALREIDPAAASAADAAVAEQARLGWPSPRWDTAWIAAGGSRRYVPVVRRAEAPR